MKVCHFDWMVLNASFGLGLMSHKQQGQLAVLHDAGHLTGHSEWRKRVGLPHGQAASALEGHSTLAGSCAMYPKNSK